MVRFGPNPRRICPKSTSKSACRRPKAKSLARGEGAADIDDLIGEAHTTLGATEERQSHMTLPLPGAPTVVGSVPRP
jgi:hypothetical protein